MLLLLPRISYYFNKSTGVTQWERPAEMGAAPLATGWFGRGMAGSSAAQEFEARNRQYLSRPARKQKDFVDPKKYHVEGANEYNIWYGRYYGDQNDRSDREAATDRCVLQTDAGYTKADGGRKAATGAVVQKGRRFFCIHFARGVCAKGADCDFYHRVPIPADDRAIDELVDCFGRSRHSKHRDDMNGTGSFMKPCRTLFVGNLLKGKYSSPSDLEKAVWKHFAEWGELESCNVVHRLSIAFPRYRLRTSAEFAKEAMSCQALDHAEILSIRWAHDDPNPVAKDAIARADKDALVSFLTAQGISVTATGFEYPANYDVPDAKRPRLEDGSAAAEFGENAAEVAALLQQQPDLAYPNTDSQYHSQGAPSEEQLAKQWVDYYAKAAEAAGMTPEAYEAYCRQYYASYPAAAAAGSVASCGGHDSVAAADDSSALDRKKNALSQLIDGYSGQQAPDTNGDVAASAVSADVDVAEAGAGAGQNDGGEEDTNDDREGEEGEESSGNEEEGPAWERIQDSSTGAYYYFNSRTGESSWTKPDTDENSP